jgi:hypothetical protein
MTRRHWTINTYLSGVEREIEVYLYDDKLKLRRAARDHGKRWEMDGSGFANAVGVTHGYTRIGIGSDGTETPHPQAATLRFARGFLTPEIVAHEVAHVAQHLYRLDIYDSVEQDGKEHWNAANEEFAHLLGALFTTIWTLLEDERET